MDAGERELFTAAVAQAVAAADRDAALDRLGWDDALAAEPQLAVAALFEAQGRTGTGLGGLDRVLCAALGVERAGLVLPELGSTLPPGMVDGDELVVLGLVARPLAPAVHVVAFDQDGATSLRTFPSAELAPRDVHGLDPGLGLVELGGTATGANAAAAPSVPWEAAVAAGQRALAHQLVGTSAAMLELARTHALDRIQFGVPIASFQAVRHRLAEALVAVEAARAALDAAWDQGDPFSAAVAKAAAGRGARIVAKHAQQVLAGIGFTAEHGFHLHFRRARLLDALLGDARTLTQQIGARLLEDRRMPPLLPL